MNCIKNDRNSNQQGKVNAKVESFKKEVRDLRLQMKSKKKTKHNNNLIESNPDLDSF